MVKVASFVAVNEPQQAGPSEQETQEAREARLISLYEGALRSVQRGEAAEAKASLTAILADPLVEAAASPQLGRIKFLSLKNLGGLQAAAGPGRDAPGALGCYVAACELEAGDVVLWNRLGTLAAESGYWALARHAFESGLECSPGHPALRAKLQQLLRHLGDPVAAAAAVLLSAMPRGQLSTAVPALLRLPAVSAVPDDALAVAAPSDPRTLHLSDATWAAVLTSALAASTPGHAPAAVRLAVSPLRKTHSKHHPLGTATATTGGGAAGTAGAEPVAEVVRLQLTPTKVRPLGPAPTAEGAADATPGGPAAAAAAAGAAMEIEGPEEEHVAVELTIQPQPTATAAATLAAAVLPSPGLFGATPQQQRTAEGAPADETPAAAPGGPQAAPASHNSRRRQRGSSRRRAAAAEPEAGTPHAPSQTTLLSLLKLLGEPAAAGEEPSGSTDAAPAAAAAGAPGGEGAAAAGPAAAEVAAGPGGAGAASTAGGPQQLQQQPGQQQQQQQNEDEEGAKAAAEVAAAVRSFVSELPTLGLHPTQLLMVLVRRMASSPAAAAALSGAERALLLRAAERLQGGGRDGGLWESCSLPAPCCLVLAELCLSEAAAGQGKGSAAVQGGQPQPGAAKDSGRVRGSGRAHHAERPVPPAQLRRRAELWLARHLAASAMAVLDEEGEAAAELGALGRRLAALVTTAAPAPEPAAAAAAPAGAAAGGAKPEAQATGEAGSTAVRYFWARAQVAEARGEVAEAAGLYQRCLQALQDAGLEAVELPHWPQPAPAGPTLAAAASQAAAAAATLSITSAAINGKLEVLRLHDMVAEAEQLAQRAQHAEVADLLTPFLLPCNAREANMAALDAAQWQRALGLLRDAALAAGRPWVAAGCQLRLLWAELARLPAVVEAGTAPLGGPPKEASRALTKAAREALAHDAAPALNAALEATVQFLAAHRPELQPQQHHEGEVRQGATAAITAAGDQGWGGWEWALLRRSQRRLVGLAEGWRAALVSDKAKSSHLSMKTSAMHRAIASASSLVVHTWALDPEAPHDAAAAAALLRTLCEGLAEAHVLADGDAPFVQLCAHELRAAMEALQAEHGGGLSDGEEGEEGGPTPSDLYWALKCGLHSCLYWLYRVELPGRWEDPWAPDFEPPEQLPERLLGSLPACVAVWPLVQPYYEGLLADRDEEGRELPESEQLQNFKELQKCEGFLRLLEARLPPPPAAARARLDAAWLELESRGPPDDMLAAPAENPLEGPWLLGEGASGAGAEALGAGGTALELPAGGAAPMAVDGGEAEEAAAAEGAAEGVPPAEGGEQGEQGLSEEEEEACRSMRSILYRLLAQLQPDLQTGTSMLAPEAEAALERLLEPFKLDLLYCPDRFWTWEQAAINYYEFADLLLEEASAHLTAADWHSAQHAAVRARYARCRNLGFQCTALAVRYADSPDRRAQLLAGTGHRLYNPLKKLPPFFDQLAAPATPAPCTPGGDAAAAAPSPSQGQQEREDARLACERALRAFEGTVELHPDDWECALLAAKCRRKLGCPPAKWLPGLAEACHLAAVHAGGMLGALYTLHAARLKLVLSTRSALSGAAGDAAAAAAVDEGAEATLQLVARQCFLRESQLALEGWLGQQQPGAGSGSGDQEMPDADGLSAEPAAANAAAEDEDEGANPSAPVEGGAGPAAAHSAGDAAEVLLRDCLEAIRWCQQYDKGFHRATYRLAEARLATEGPTAALEELSALFSKPKQPFCINVASIQEADAAGAGRGSGKKKGRNAAQRGGETPQAARAGAPERDWGLRPARLAGVGQQEDAWQFFGSVRKYLRRYLQLLAEEGQLELLRAAAAFLSSNATWGPAQLPSFADVRRVAEGFVTLATLRSAHSVAAPARLLAALPEPRASEVPALAEAAAALAQADTQAQLVGMAEGPAEAAPAGEAASPADAAAPAAEAPAEPEASDQGGPRLGAELDTIAAELEAGGGVEAAEAIMEPLYQFWVEHSLQPKEGAPGWGEGVLAPAQQALRAGGALPGLRGQLERSEALFGAYAALYVRLLGGRGGSEKLLSAARALLRSRSKGGAPPSQPVQLHLEQLLQQAFAALQAAGTAVQGEAEGLRPELAAPPAAAAAPAPPAAEPPSQGQLAHAAAAAPHPPSPASLQQQPLQRQQQRRATQEELLPLLTPQERLLYLQSLDMIREHPGGAQLYDQCVENPVEGMRKAIVSGLISPDSALRIVQYVGSLQHQPPAQQQAAGSPPGLLPGALPAAQRPVLAVSPTGQLVLLPPPAPQPMLIQSSRDAAPAPGAAACQPPAASPAQPPAAPLSPSAPQQQDGAGNAPAPAAGGPGSGGQLGELDAAVASQQQQEAPPAAAASAAAEEGPAAQAAGPAGPALAASSGELPPVPEPLTEEEQALVERAVALLRGLRELQKAVSAAGQSANWIGAVPDRLAALLKRCEDPLRRAFHVYLALTRAPGPPPPAKLALQKACDEAIKQQRRLSQKGPGPSGAAAAAGGAAVEAGAESETAGAGTGGGGRKRGRGAAPGVSREASVAASDQGGDSAAEGPPGTIRKRGRREAPASAPPSPLQPLGPEPPAAAAQGPGGATEEEALVEAADAEPGPSTAAAGSAEAPATAAGAKRPEPESGRSGEGSPPPKRPASAPAAAPEEEPAGGPPGSGSGEGEQPGEQQPQQVVVVEAACPPQADAHQAEPRAKEPAPAGSAPLSPHQGNNSSSHQGGAAQRMALLKRQMHKAPGPGEPLPAALRMLRTCEEQS